MKHRNEPCTVFQNTLFDDSKNILNRISFRKYMYVFHQENVRPQYT